MRPVGYRLYSSRNFSPLSDTLELLYETGYSYVEGYGQMLGNSDSIAQVARLLEANHLTMPSAQFNLSTIQNAPEKIIDAAQVLGIKVIVMPYIVEALRPRTREGWQSFGHLLSDMAKPLMDAGLEFAYRNTDFEFTTLDSGERPLELILDSSPYLKFELDAAWAHRSGACPEDWIKSYAEKLNLVHVKDVAQTGRNVDEDGWADVGYGVMNWKSIWDALDAAKVEYRFVDHGNPADHWRFARRSMGTITALDA